MPKMTLRTLAVVFPILLSLAVQAQVTTSQNDNARTGAVLNETTLTPENVNARQFGRLFSFRIEGNVYAQPLYLPGVDIPGKGKHNVVYVATEHNSVYAFDAEGNPSTPLWQVSFINPDAGVTTVPAKDVERPCITPEIGITSTPVIDLKTGTLYVLARTKEHKGFLQDEYVQRLHALAVTTGVEKFGGPIVIRASVPGSGAGSSQGKVDFDPLRQNQRAALLLANGTIYLAWAASCGGGVYHGWVMAYDARTLAQKAALNVTPDAAGGGIWLGGKGPAADNDGNVFLATGNGKFDAPNGRDYGDSVLKLGLDGQNFVVRDYFTPSNQEELVANDKDLGSGGPVLLPDQPGARQRLLVVSGKGGTVYLIDRDHMGKFQAGTDSHAVQSQHVAPTETFGSPAYWNQHVYYLFGEDVLRDYAVERGQLSLKAASGRKFRAPGATPTVSANGTKDGIVWVIEAKGWRSKDQPAMLAAYDAANVTTELYTSEQNSTRDRPGWAARFSVPTVANGRVYVGTTGEVDVYGLLPSR